MKNEKLELEQAIMCLNKVGFTSVAAA